MSVINGDSGDNTLNGTDADDTLNGRAGDDILTDDLGDDALNGAGGNDTLNGGAGSNYLNGGTGDDIIRVGGNPPVAGVVNTVFGGAGDDSVFLLGGVENLHGGAGFDTLFLFDGNIFHNFTAANGFEELFFDSGFQHGTADADLLDFSGFSIRAGSVTPFVLMEGGNDRFIGSSVAETVSGGDGNDRLSGGGGDDSLTGDAGADQLNGGAGNDRLDGGAGVDTANYDSAGAGVVVRLLVAGAQDTGGAGVDTLVSIANLTGSGFGDSLFGDNINNVLTGAGGDDSLDGGRGADTLVGGGGRDILTGGDDADRFVFLAASDSRPSVALSDVVTDFHHDQADQIDLAGVYGGTLAYMGAAAFTGTGVSELRSEARGADQLVQVDVDGDGHADMFILLAGVSAVDATDFVL